MDGPWNVFRFLGDFTHALSKAVLIWSIHSNKSAEGISLITQVLYTIIFSSRYLDILRPSTYAGTDADYFWYNFAFKIGYIATSLYIVYVMLRVFARSRERERAWRFGAYCLGGSLVSAPFIMMIFRAQKHWSFWQFAWAFSEILESVCVLPQLMLLRQTNVPTVIDSFYLVLLGSYRLFYILNWIVRGVGTEKHFDAISTIFGTVQVLFYIDFAWVYWSRQRVKLRNGGVVDGDDIGRGYLISKVLGRPSSDGHDDDWAENASGEDGSGGGRQQRWGTRGISVSADEETPYESERGRGREIRFSDGASRQEVEAGRPPDEGHQELDFSDDEDAEPLPSPKHQEQEEAVIPPDVGNGAEWRNNT